MIAQKSELEAMPLDQLWSLHEVISAVLVERLQDQKRQLEKRLSLLNPARLHSNPSTNRFPARPGANTPRSGRDIAILGRTKLGRVAESSRDGW